VAYIAPDREGGVGTFTLMAEREESRAVSAAAQPWAEFLVRSRESGKIDRAPLRGLKQGESNSAHQVELDLSIARYEGLVKREEP